MHWALQRKGASSSAKALVVLAMWALGILWQQSC